MNILTVKFFRDKFQSLVCLLLLLLTLQRKDFRFLYSIHLLIRPVYPSISSSQKICKVYKFFHFSFLGDSKKCYMAMLMFLWGLDSCCLCWENIIL